MDPAIFQIEDTGRLAFTVVDRGASGYLDTWQTPGGVALPTITAAAYTDAEDGGWSCQITSGKLTPSKQTTRRDRPATFCAPASSNVQVGRSTFALDVAFFQDAHLRAGLTAYLYQHDTEEAFFYLGSDGDNPPKAAGRVKLVAGGFGGEPRADLTDTVSLDVVGSPAMVFGDATAWTYVTGDGVVTQGPPA